MNPHGGFGFLQSLTVYEDTLPDCARLGVSMRNRRIVCFLMGTWIGVSAMLAINVYRNFDAVEAVLSSPPEPATKIFKTLGPDNARRLLRYTAGAENADTFEVWEDGQMALGLFIALILFLGSSTRVMSPIPIVMVLLVVFLHVKITPELAWLGRSLEFMTPSDPVMSQAQFWRLHRIYEILETVKCLLGMGLTAFLVTQNKAKVVRRRHHHEEPLTDFNRHAASR